MLDASEISSSCHSKYPLSLSSICSVGLSDSSLESGDMIYISLKWKESLCMPVVQMVFRRNLKKKKHFHAAQVM